MAQRNRGNPWGQGSQGGGKQGKSAKKNSPVSPPPPVKSAEERFRQAQAKLQESVQKHLDQELELSSEEEELETDDIYDSVIQNYSQIGGKNEDLGKTQNFLENIFRSDVAICLICIATIKRADKIWSCGSCYGFFHLLCIQRWGKDSIAHQKLAEEERITTAKKEYHWPCPKCRKNYTAQSVPQRYECFCRQVIDPPYQPWLVPHSCGQVCGKDLVPSCGHSCLLLCHPGPCPPCPKMVRAKCYCSNGGEKMVRCCYKEWSCGQKCSKKLACQKHKCEAVCHVGECPACPKTSMISCDCKSQSRMTACAELSWKCDKVCGKSLDCGKHNCELVCHKGDCGPCPRTLPRACPCGAEENVLPCTQEVATCGSTCGKLLDCGLHTCNQRCHRGSCGACMEFLAKYCRCGLHKKEIACIKEYLCDTKCKGIRDCGVHPCNRKCCDGRCPPCEKVCGKTLRCGQHKCASVCHRGPCYPCEQTKQLSCRCGSTVITVPCGTHKRKKNLKCNKLCLIPPDCHHEKREEHKCHLGPCPPCRQICHKPRECGHPCSLNCHSSVVVSAVPNYKPATPWDRVTASTQIEELLCPPCEGVSGFWCQEKHEMGVLLQSSPSDLPDNKAPEGAMSQETKDLVAEEPKPSDTRKDPFLSRSEMPPIRMLQGYKPRVLVPDWSALKPKDLASSDAYYQWLTNQGIEPLEAMEQAAFCFEEAPSQGGAPPAEEPYSVLPWGKCPAVGLFGPLAQSAKPEPGPSDFQRMSKEKELNSTTENKGELVRMRGTQKKRYLHFIRKGFKHEEAIEASKNMKVFKKCADSHKESKKQLFTKGTTLDSQKEGDSKIRFAPHGGAQPPDKGAELLTKVAKPSTKRAELPNSVAKLANKGAEFQNKVAKPPNTSAEPVNKRKDLPNKVEEPPNKGAQPPSEAAELPNKVEEPPNEGAQPPSEAAELPDKVAEPPNEGAQPPYKGAQPPNKVAELQNKVAAPANKGEVPPKYTVWPLDTLKGVRVGISHADYPVTVLTNQQLDNIQEEILQAILDVPMTELSPAFFSLTYKTGWLLLHCRDQQTLEWLRGLICVSVLLDGTPLRVIPINRIAVGDFPNSAADSEDRILHWLRRQNPGLNTELWIVIQRTDTDEGKFSQLTMLVDGASASAIEANQHVHYKFGTVVLRLEKA